MSKFFPLGRRRSFKCLSLLLCLIVLYFIWNLDVFIKIADRRQGHEVKHEEQRRKRPYNAHFEEIFKKEQAEIIPGLGELGKAATLPPELKDKADQIFQKEAFNLLLSNKISYNRSLPDPRDPRCLDSKYPKDLPSASVVIIFTNERWSSLIRTIHSVIRKTPDEYLKEIILVDDFSDHEELMEKLDYYIETRFPPKVKLFRLDKRSGLIRARLHGARKATGDVVLFLDAHCEVTIQWIEPLLARIKEDRTAVVVPIIDVIDDKTLEYQNNGGSIDFEVGGFTWSGHFTWIPISEEEKMRRQSPENPTRSPTMAGGLFAMDRKFFWEVGSYDELMDVWGGENLEMSFRIWQCGGVLETIPCSRVGHIFRSFHPYTFPGSKDTHGINTARLVKVWMDGYQRLFFQHRPDLRDIDIGDISERLELKKKLGCKPFSWYLKNIYKSKFVPDDDVFFFGQVKTSINKMCLDGLQRDEQAKTTLGMYFCNGQLVMSQYFSLSHKNELRREFNCAQSRTDTNKVYLDRCNGELDQKWIYNEHKQFVNRFSQKCLDTRLSKASADVEAHPCNTSIPTQIWTWV